MFEEKAKGMCYISSVVIGIYSIFIISSIANKPRNVTAFSHLKPI